MHVTELRIGALGVPDHEVWRLLTVATGRPKRELAMNPPVTDEEAMRFSELVRRRRRGEPLQYLEGTVQFGPLELAIDRRALVPRVETELLWDMVRQRLEDDPPSIVVDLCTGSGNLALAFKFSFPHAVVFATELFSGTADLARSNVERTGLDVTVLEGDLFDPLPDAVRGRVDLLVANPPYLADSEVTDLPIDVRDHEPWEALVGGARGDELLARIAAEAPEWLRPGGLIAVEISEFMGQHCLELFSDFNPSLEQDLTGRDRFILGTAPLSSE